MLRALTANSSRLLPNAASNRSQTRSRAAVVYGVIFAALLPATPSAALSLALPPSVFVLEGSWYVLVALALSSARPRQTYLQAKTAIDRATGAVLGLLGIKLLLSSR